MGRIGQKAKYHEKGDLETQLRAFTQEMVTNWYYSSIFSYKGVKYQLGSENKHFLFCASLGFC